MKLIINRFMTDVCELSIDLNKQNLKKISELVSQLQEDGLCESINTSSAKDFRESLELNPDHAAEIFEIMIENGLGVESKYVDSTNESYEAIFDN